MATTEKRILIIDPDGRDRKEMTMFLQKENFNVETGKGLPEAIKKVSEGCFNCLIMDVNLPEMKGYEAVSIIKSMEAKVREQDIFFYFIKSFGKEELKLAIHNAFSK